jgi:LacI family transcriptional regulator
MVSLPQLINSNWIFWEKTFMTTIHDVAKRAGVAPITVSRVINNRGYISQETRSSVMAAIDELGYVPNVLARSLRSKKTHTLALVLTDITNPFFTIMARGVEDTASKAGYNVIFCNTDESEEKEEKYIQLLLQKQVDGILLVPANSSSKSISAILDQGTPTVVLDRRVTTPVDVVRCDSEDGGYQLARLLLDLGHRRIAVLNGSFNVSTSRDRQTGFRRAMQEYGIETQELDYFGAFTQLSGYEMTKQAMAQTPRPTAIFAGNNLIAIGTLWALRDLGFKVPEDVAVVSVDDLPQSLMAAPFLTVASQPAYEMSKKATELLLARLEGRSDEIQDIVLPIELIIRSSSGGPVI